MNQAAKPETFPTPEVSEAPAKRPFRLNPALCALALFGLACLAGTAVVLWPQAAGPGGLALLISITIIGGVLFVSVARGPRAHPGTPGRVVRARRGRRPPPPLLPRR